jgi:hypothetical protein
MSGGKLEFDRLQNEIGENLVRHFLARAAGIDEMSFPSSV